MRGTQSWIAAFVVAGLLIVALLWLGAGGEDAPSTEGATEKTETLILGAVINGATREAIPNARLQVDGPGEKRSWIIADEFGQFRLQGVPPGSYLLRSEVEGLRTSGRESDGLALSLEEGEQTIGVELVLWPGAGLRGQIILGDQPGFAEVIVRYLVDGSGSKGYELEAITSDDDGRFFLEGLAPGDVELDVIAGRFVLRMPIATRLTAGQTQDLGEVVLTRGAIIRGAVVDNTGHPLEGVVVKAIDGNEPSARLPGTITDALGDFELVGVEGTWVTLRFTATGFGAARREVKFIPGQAIELKDVTLDPLEGLIVRVLTAQGEEISGATVQVISDPAAPPIHESTTNGDDLTLDDLRGGPYLVQASHWAFGPSAQVLTSAGQSVTLRLGDANVIEGHVRAPDGRAPLMASVTLYLLGEDSEAPKRVGTKSAAEGAFMFAAIAEGRYVVEAKAAGFSSTRSDAIDLQPGQRVPLTLVLSRGGRITGTVVDDQTEEPIAGAVIEVGVGSDEELETLGRRVFTDDEGRFSIEGISDARHTVEVSARGYVSRMVSAISLDDGQEQPLWIALSALEEGARGGLELVGIGASLRRAEGGVSVHNLAQDGPALGGGLAEGDIILSVDNTPVDAMAVEAVVERIRGDEGTPVVLQVRRGDGSVENITLTRTRVIHRWD